MKINKITTVRELKEKNKINEVVNNIIKMIEDKISTIKYDSDNKYKIELVFPSKEIVGDLSLFDKALDIVQNEYSTKGGWIVSVKHDFSEDFEPFRQNVVVFNQKRDYKIIFTLETPS